MKNYIDLLSKFIKNLTISIHMKRLFFFSAFLVQALFFSNYLLAQVFVELSHFQAPELTIIDLDSLSIDEGESIQLGDINMVSGGTLPYTYLWEPSIGLDYYNIAHPIASPNETTTYTLTVIDNNGCELTTQQTVIFHISSFVKQEYLSDIFKVYPNPSNGVFSIAGNKANISSDLMITVYTVTGKEIFRRTDVMNAALNIRQINLQNQPKGIYILQIQSDEGLFRISISIQ